MEVGQTKDWGFYGDLLHFHYNYSDCAGGGNHGSKQGLKVTVFQVCNLKRSLSLPALTNEAVFSA